VRHHKRQTFPTLRAALEFRHPLLQDAERDSGRLHGRQLLTAAWSDVEARLVFGGGMCLRIGIADHFVKWHVQPAELAPGTDDCAAACVDLDRGSNAGVERFHRRETLMKRIGRELDRLFVNEMGLLVYFSDCAILWFDAIANLGSGVDVLYYGDFE
jgi:hypothetical protein